MTNRPKRTSAKRVDKRNRRSDLLRRRYDITTRNFHSPPRPLQLAVWLATDAAQLVAERSEVSQSQAKQSQLPSPARSRPSPWQCSSGAYRQQHTGTDAPAVQRRLSIRSKHVEKSKFLHLHFFALSRQGCPVAVGAPNVMHGGIVADSMGAMGTFAPVVFNSNERVH